MTNSSSPARAGHDAVPRLTYPARLPLRSDGSRLMTLSVSSLRLFWRCPERWRRRYLAREPEPRSGAMIAGAAAGAVATAWYAARMRGVALSAADADDLVKAEFAERAGQPRVDFGHDTPVALRDQARKALRCYLRKLAPTVRPRAVERKLELRFDRAEWSFVGYVDLEDERGHVIDLKLVARHLGQAAADRDPQAAGYLLARRLEGRPAPRFEFHSIRRGVVRTGERCLSIPTSRTDAQLDAFAGRIAQTARAIERCARSGDWPLASPDGWWCGPGQCRHWLSCPAGAAG
jgi:PD-(D/E)XK nuclease superfamily